MLFVILLTLLSLSLALNPGIRLQANQNAINYAKNIAMEALNKKLSGYTVDSVSGNTSGIQYWITNVRISEFNAPNDKASITLKDPNDIAIAITVSASLVADYKVRVGSKWFYVDHYGNVTGQAGASANVQGGLTAVKGKPQVNLDQCHFTIGKLNVTFNGNLVDQLLDMVKDIAVTLFKSQLGRIICQQVLPKIVSDDANKQLAQLPTSIEDPSSGFGVDYSLVGNPVIQNGIASIGLLGKVIFKGHEHDSSIPVAFPTPAIKNSNKMICLNMDAEEVLGSGGYALVISGKAHLLIDKDFLAKEKLSELVPMFKCNCALLPYCIGKLVPQIKTKCTNGDVQIGIKLTEGPTAYVNSSGAFISLHGQADFGAKLTSGQVVQLFSVKVGASAVLPSTVKFDNWTIKGEVHVTGAELTLISSQIGNIDQQGLEQIWQMALVLVVEQELNKLAAKGIPLPPIKDVKVLEPQLYFGNHTLTLCFNVEYNGHV